MAVFRQYSGCIGFSNLHSPSLVWVERVHKVFSQMSLQLLKRTEISQQPLSIRGLVRQKVLARQSDGQIEGVWHPLVRFPNPLATFKIFKKKVSWGTWLGIHLHLVCEWQPLGKLPVHLGCKMRANKHEIIYYFVFVSSNFACQMHWEYILGCPKMKKKIIFCAA